MSELHTKLELGVEVLSPLHIGSGAELMLGYDLVPYNGRTHRVDEEVLLERALLETGVIGAEEVNRALLGRPAVELLEEPDFSDPEGKMFRYVLEGAPSKLEGRVSEQIKDVYDRVYLPGSSLKGALRTLLAWGIHAAENRMPDLERLGRRRSWAAQPIEREIFGRNANRDWLRAVQVADSQALSPADRLALCRVRVYPTAGEGGSPGLDVDVEAVQPGTTFRTAITVNGYGFESDIAPQLGWQGRVRWIRRLPALGREHARRRLLTEAQYFRARGGPRDVMRFYDQLITLWDELSEGAFIAQIGWGAGWESKTLGSDLLRQDDRQFEDLLDTYRMTKERGREPGDPFPKSRHLVVVRERPALPLGWVQITMEGLEALEEEAPSEVEEALRGQPTGRVARFIYRGSYGFIQPDGGGEDVFVHISDVAGESVLRSGQRVAFDVETTERGPRAVNVRVLEG